MEAEDFVEYKEMSEHAVGLTDIQPDQYKPEPTTQ